MTEHQARAKNARLLLTNPSHCKQCMVQQGKQWEAKVVLCLEPRWHPDRKQRVKCSTVYRLSHWQRMACTPRRTRRAVLLSHHDTLEEVRRGPGVLRIIELNVCQLPASGEMRPISQWFHQQHQHIRQDEGSDFL